MDHDLVEASETGSDRKGLQPNEGPLTQKAAVTSAREAHRLSGPDPMTSPTNEQTPRVSSQLDDSAEASTSGRPSYHANTRYFSPHSRPTSPPVPTLRNIPRADSPSEPHKTALERGPSSPRAQSPLLQKLRSFGRSNVSSKRTTSMLVGERVRSGWRTGVEYGDSDEQVSPRAFEVKPLSDSDGLCAILYHYLWRKTSKGKGCPGLNLPDTIVYRYRQPTHWFFTSVHDGQLMKKNRANVLNRTIHESLSKSRGRVSDIVACHLYTDDDVRHKMNGPAEKVTNVEYFDEPGLKSFLFHGEKQMHAVLQRFVESKGDRNALIQAMWSPQVCLLERRINLRRIKDPLNELHEKAVTFEGAEQFSESVAVPADALAAEVQRICKNIVQHIAETSSGQSLISRMVLHFKVDAKNKIWLLWCSSIRLFQGVKVSRQVAPLNLDPPFLVKTNADAEKQSKHGGGNGSGGLWFTCPGCGETFGSDRKCDVTYKAVINHWQKTCTFPEHDSVPPVISKANPGLSEARYGILKHHPVFLYKSVSLCEACCTERNNTMLADLAAQNPASYQGEGPTGGRRLGVPSLAGAFKRLGSAGGSQNSARVRSPVTSRPARAAAVVMVRPRPRSAFVSGMSRRLSGTGKEGRGNLGDGDDNGCGTRGDGFEDGSRTGGERNGKGDRNGSGIDGCGSGSESVIGEGDGNRTGNGEGKETGSAIGEGDGDNNGTGHIKGADNEAGGQSGSGKGPENGTGNGNGSGDGNGNESGNEISDRRSYGIGEEGKNGDSICIESAKADDDGSTGLVRERTHSATDDLSVNETTAEPEASEAQASARPTQRGYEATAQGEQTPSQSPRAGAQKQRGGRDSGLKVGPSFGQGIWAHSLARKENVEKDKLAFGLRENGLTGFREAGPLSSRRKGDRCKEGSLADRARAVYSKKITPLWSVSKT